MPKVHSKPLRKTLEVDRIIGHIKGSGSGPTLIFTGGIHGNESSGVFALHTVYEAIKKNGLPINGSFYALSGNLWALEREKRYHKQDLNRLWTTDNVNLLRDGNLIPENEDLAQQMEIYKTLSNIMENESGPFYFMDLHTTSSQTIPFLTVNDSLLNRKFCEQYPIPMILGIEEYLDGPLLNWVNDLGYVAFGYEAGQHDSLSSIENHIAFIYLSMVFTGCLEKSDIDFDHYFQVLEKTAMNFRHVYEIFYRYQINEKEEF
ncbi:MAG: succinylglutamate desuccinylase/aspartoacylase family protein, partial [Bacteroidota bacterium]